MGFFDKLLGEFIDVIEWIDNSNDTMVYRFNRYANEIKNGAKLIVRESQIAILVNEGEIADIFEAGIYELTTQNMPLLTSLNHWDHSFNSPFKAEVYFFNMKKFTDLKWGTKNPIMLRDKEFGALRIRSFGSYNIHIVDPELFLREIVGTDGYFSVDEISDQLRNLIVTYFATILGQMKVPVLDLAANYEMLGDFIQDKIAKDFSAYGLELDRLLIENISLPPKVEEALDNRTSMELTGDLDKYLKYQSAQSLTMNTTSNDAINMGMGFAMAQGMVNQFNNGSNTSNTATPPPIPKAQIYHLAIDGVAKGPLTLEQMKRMIKNHEITKDTLAWREGMASWSKMIDIAELNRLFSATPPPIPNK
jgi:membrane protease subunit (stomatin/prohibitin family)